MLMQLRTFGEEESRLCPRYLNMVLVAGIGYLGRSDEVPGMRSDF